MNMSAIRRRDPYLERELKHYEQPLPSREYILQMLEEQGKPVGFDELCALLDIQTTEFEPFQRRLRAMEREAQLLRNRKASYLLPERASLFAWGSVPPRWQGCSPMNCELLRNKQQRISQVIRAWRCTVAGCYPPIITHRALSGSSTCS